MQLREIQHKISLTKNISQIARALGLVSAVKMKKAQKIALKSRMFSNKTLEILDKLAKYHKEDLNKKVFYFHQKKVKNIMAVVIASDKGFCSAFNKNILNFAEKEIKILKQEANVDIFPIGKKAINFFKKKIKNKRNLTDKNNLLKKSRVFKVEFSGIGDYGEFEEVRPIAELLTNYFKKNKFQKIFLFYTDFISSFKQIPKKIQILPIDLETIEEMLENYKLKNKNKEKINLKDSKKSNYIFEPSTKEIFENLVPQLVEFEVYHSILEANASEHSARMMAMKSASKSAKEVIENLILEYNKARQQQITSEVCEISSAKDALS